MRWTKNISMLFFIAATCYLSICLLYRVLICSPTTGAAVWLSISLEFSLTLDASVHCLFTASTFASQSDLSQGRGKSSPGNSGADLGLVCKGNIDATDSSCLALQMLTQRQCGSMTRVRSTWFCSRSKIVSLRASWSNQDFPSVLSSWKQLVFSVVCYL